MVTDSAAGQISGFTTMVDFKTRFAEYNAATGEYAFSNVRNGLIVGLVCHTYNPV
jgi:SP family sugar:H+ symporter-like MFS transporter